jgi:hypothetical protein
MNGVILSGDAAMLHEAGALLSLTAAPQALIRALLRRAAVRFERTEVSLRMIRTLRRKTAVSDSLRSVSLKVTAVRKRRRWKIAFRDAFHNRHPSAIAARFRPSRMPSYSGRLIP